MADRSSPVAVLSEGIFTQVTAGIESGYGLRNDGRVFSWGDNQYGQLGDGTIIGKSTPGIVAGIHKFDYIAAGWHHILGLKSNLSLWAWGRGDSGQLGTGTTSAASPISVAGGHEFIKVDAGECHSIGLKADGSVWTWGCNDNNQLGYEIFTGAIGAVADGGGQAIDQNGVLWGWGLNISGYLGDGTTTARSSPVSVLNTGGNSWLAITPGPFPGVLFPSGDWLDDPCAIPGNCRGIGRTGANEQWGIKDEGNGETSLWMWGDNYYGSLGNGTWLVDASSPTSVLNSRNWGFWTAQAGNVSCALDRYGKLWCWGRTSQYPLNFGDIPQSFSSPVEVSGIMQDHCPPDDWYCTDFIGRGHKVLSMNAGGLNGIVLDFGGSAWLWGSSGSSTGHMCQGVLGAGTQFGSPTQMPTGLGWPNVWVHAAMGEGHSIYISGQAILDTNERDVWMCGYNDVTAAMEGAKFGAGGPTGRSTPTVVIGRPHSAIKVDAGISSPTFGFLREDGSLWMWGENNNGECGVGNLTNPITSPTSVLGSGQSYSFVDFVIGGESGTVALDNLGRVWGWGQWGHVGDNTTNNRSIPTMTSLPAITPKTYQTTPRIVQGEYSGFSDISAGDNHNLAIDENDFVWAWGDNAGGQLGDGTTTNKSSPISVPGLSNIIDIAAGTQYSYALDANGQIWQWGDIPCDNPTSTPVAMPLPCEFDIECAYQTTLMTSSLWGWGDNSQGQLGIGDITDRWVPTLIKSRSFKAIGVGTTHNIVLELDGTARTFGDNSAGQLGNNSTTDSSYPVSVAGGHVFEKVCAGFSHTCGMKADGTVWCWGGNTYGELGANLPNTSRSSPVSVFGGHSFVDLVCNGRTTFGIKANGEAWAWGRDLDGALGVVTPTGDQSTPASVAGNYNWRMISPGTNYTVLGCDVGGNAFGWGTNDYGEVGDGTQTNRGSPTPVAGGHKFVKMAAGSLHSMGLKEDGSVWAWGRGEEAGLYNGCALGIESAGQNYSSPISVYRTWMFDRLASGIGPGYNYTPGTRSVWTDDYRDDLFNPAGKAISFIDIRAGYYHNIGLEQRPEGCRIWKWGQGAGGRLGIDTIEVVGGTPLYTPASTLPSYDDMWFPGKDFFDTSYGASSNLAPYWLTWGPVARSGGMHIWSSDGASTDTQNMAYAVAYVGSSNFAFNTFFRINQTFWANSNWQRCGIFFWIDHENWFGIWRTYADGNKREVRQTVNGVGSTRSAAANTDFELGFQLGRTDTDFNARWGNDGVTWNNIGTWSLGGWAGKSGFIGLFANHNDEFPGTPPDVLSFGVTFDWIKASSLSPPAGWTPAFGNP